MEFEVSISATSRARTSFHMHVILERARETASTVRFVPLPSTSSAHPPCPSMYVNHVMASEELAKIPVFSTPTYASTLLHMLEHRRLYGVASNIEWFQYLVSTSPISLRIVPPILVRDAAATHAGSLQSTWPQHLYAEIWGCRTVSERQ